MRKDIEQFIKENGLTNKLNHLVSRFDNIREGDYVLTKFKSAGQSFLRIDYTPKGKNVLENYHIFLL